MSSSAQSEVKSVIHGAMYHAEKMGLLPKRTLCSVKSLDADGQVSMIVTIKSVDLGKVHPVSRGYLLQAIVTRVRREALSVNAGGLAITVRIADGVVGVPPEWEAASRLVSGLGDISTRISELEARYIHFDRFRDAADTVIREAVAQTGGSASEAIDE
jgi:hypothetical protein